MTADHVPDISSSIPHIEYTYFDEGGEPVDESYDRRFVRIVRRDNEDFLSQQRVIDRLSVAKPDWFVEAEVRASSELRKIGIRADPEIYLLKQDESLVEVGLPDAYPSVGSCLVFTRKVCFREERLRQRYHMLGIVDTIGFVAHELVHADVPAVESVELHKTSRGRIVEKYEDGITSHDGTRDKGTFYEEGLATLVQSLVMQDVSETPLRPLRDPPSDAYLPPKYAVINQDHTGEYNRVSGPDGYALERLAGAVERRDILPAAEFITVLIEARRPDLFPAAQNDFSAAINGVQEGLYDRLDVLQPTRSAWKGT